MGDENNDQVTEFQVTGLDALSDDDKKFLSEKFDGDLSKFLAAHRDINDKYGKQTKEVGKLRKKIGGGDNKSGDDTGDDGSDDDGGGNKALDSVRKVIMKDARKTAISNLEKEPYYKVLAPKLKKAILEDPKLVSMGKSLANVDVSDLEDAIVEFYEHAFNRIMAQNRELVVEALKNPDPQYLERSGSGGGGKADKGANEASDILKMGIKTINDGGGI